MLNSVAFGDAGIGRVAQVKEFEVANVESLRLGRDADKIACTVDPAGYFWEVLERHERNVTEALCKVLRNTNICNTYLCVWTTHAMVTTHIYMHSLCTGSVAPM